MKLFLLSTLIGQLRMAMEGIAATKDSANTSSTSTTQDHPFQSYSIENQPEGLTKSPSTKSTTEVPLRYGNIIRMLAAAATDPNPNYGDEADRVLRNLKDEELLTLFFGTKEDIRKVIDGHGVPPGVVDMVCCVIDGEPLSTMMARLNTNAPTQIIMVPPKNKQH